jgi:hypothetical protein
MAGRTYGGIPVIEGQVVVDEDWLNKVLREQAQSWAEKQEYALKQAWGARPGEPTPDEIEAFVTAYIANDPNPTQAGAVKAWQAAGHSKRCRDWVRFYYNLRRRRRGRPRKN